MTRNFICPFTDASCERDECKKDVCANEGEPKSLMPIELTPLERLLVRALKHEQNRKHQEAVLGRHRQTLAIVHPVQPRMKKARQLGKVNAAAIVDRNARATSLCAPGQETARQLQEVHAAAFIQRYVRVLHSRAVVRDQRHQITMVIPAVFGDKPHYPQPPALLAAPAGNLEHRHALRRHIA